MTELRERCRRILTGYDEAIQYGMPTYSRKRFSEPAPRDELPKAGKGCIRYSSPAKMDSAVIEQLLREPVTDPSEPCA